MVGAARIFLLTSGANLAIPYRFPRYTPLAAFITSQDCPLYRSSRPRSEAHSVMLDGSERVCIGNDRTTVNQISALTCIARPCVSCWHVRPDLHVRAFPASTFATAGLFT